MSYKRNFAAIDWTVKAKMAPRQRGASNAARSDMPMPRVIGDYAAYECPVTGKMIEGRRAHQENLNRHDCRILERGEKEDNVRNAKAAVEKDARRRDAAIDVIVDKVASEYFS